MIILLNFAPATPATDALKEKIGRHVLEYLDSRFITEAPPVRAIEVKQCRSTKETLEACGLIDAQWQNYAIIPRISDDHPFAGALLREVNKRRGYDWPTITEKK